MISKRLWLDRENGTEVVDRVVLKDIGNRALPENKGVKSRKEVA